MQILSDYDYIVSELKCKLHVTVVLSRCYTNMITCNFTLLKIICVHTIMYVKAASYTFRMLILSNVH